MCQQQAAINIFEITGDAVFTAPFSFGECNSPVPETKLITSRVIHTLCLSYVPTTSGRHGNFLRVL